MGANNYIARGFGKTMNEAYRECVEEAREEHGHEQGYSGEINCSAGYRDVTDRWKASKLSEGDFIDLHHDDLEKGGAASGICIQEPVGNTNKIKSTVEHIVFKGARKWELLYVPSTRSESWIGKAANNKAEAVATARKHTEQTGESTVVYIERRLTAGSGNNRVAVINYKSNPKERTGNYVFFGVAPY